MALPEPLRQKVSEYAQSPGLEQAERRLNFVFLSRRVAMEWLAYCTLDRLGARLWTGRESDF